ncbi:MAG TPA: hypothetical protein VIC55_09525, partial [Gemmatimonadaceae bacterium]
MLLLLVWSVVYPNASVIAGSFGEGLRYWREFVSSPTDREALRTTIVIAVGSVIAATAVGVPLAFLLTRFEFRGRRVLSVVAT